MIKNVSYVTLKLTNRCNMNCYMCGQTYIRNELSHNDLPIEIIEERLSGIKTLETVYLFGGEPLLYKEFSRLLRYLSSRNINILISTNGTLIDRYHEDIIDCKVRDLTFSIDSSQKEIFEKIRGIGTYDVVMRNLRKLIELKHKKNSIYPHIGVNCVILHENIDEIDKIYNFFVEEFPEVERINFESPIFTTYNMGIEYEEIFKNYFNSKADSWKWFYNRVPSYTKEDIHKIVIKMAELNGKPKVTFMVSAKDKEIELEEAFSNKFEVPNIKCNFQNYSVTVLPNGDVTYCTDYPDFIAGNIIKDSILDIFNNSRTELFRKFINEHGNLPICSRCPRQRCEESFFIYV